MFVGHFALGFAAKRVAPRASLALLFAAAQLADLLWPLLLAVGLEQVRVDPGNTAFTPLDFISYPYSHSLALLVVWAIVLGAIAAVRLKPDTSDTSIPAASAVGRASGAAAPVVSTFRRTFWVIALLVVSHWLLDWITHRPDMPIYPGSATYGLGLWNSVAATLTIEVAMFVAGVWVYAASTRPRDASGRWGFIAFVVVLLGVYGANVFSAPPPSPTAIWMASIAGGILLMVWSWWFDRHRAAIVISV